MYKYIIAYIKCLKLNNVYILNSILYIIPLCIFLRCMIIYLQYSIFSQDTLVSVNIILPHKLYRTQAIITTVIKLFSTLHCVVNKTILIDNPVLNGVVIKFPNSVKNLGIGQYLFMERSNHGGVTKVYGSLNQLYKFRRNQNYVSQLHSTTNFRFLRCFVL